MGVFFYILISTSLISLIAFVGVLILYLREQLLNKIILIIVSFSAGSLLGSAFFHLLPEAIEEVGPEDDAILKIFLFLIFGFCLFFVLEQFINWHHHHTKEHPEVKSFSYLILISDGIHNFIDGLVISASYLVSIPLGIATSLAVAFHEIPQEIGDFGVLVYTGFRKIKALFLNFLSAFTVVLGGIVGFFLSEQIGESVVFLLPFAAGSFIYIATSDLIPEIKEKLFPKKSLTYFFVFLLGIITMLVIKILFEG